MKIDPGRVKPLDAEGLFQDGTSIEMFAKNELLLQIGFGSYIANSELPRSGPRPTYINVLLQSEFFVISSDHFYSYLSRNPVVTRYWCV